MAIQEDRAPAADLTPPDLTPPDLTSDGPSPAGPSPAGSPAAGTAGSAGKGEPEQERLPSFSEQLAQQLGGWRGLAEASVPVAVFVLVNIVASLNVGLISATAVAVGIATWRLSRRQPVRHAINGLVGIGIGAILAWRTGQEKDFYLPGILYGISYGVALLASAALRWPLVGWLWSVLVAGGSQAWRRDDRLMRTFGWLTVLWGVVWIAKVGVQAWLWHIDKATELGVARLLLGYPPYALLLAITVWAVRRANRNPAPAATSA